MVKTVMMMLSNQRQKWTGYIWWLCCSMLISLGQSWGQSFAERLQAGETIEVEWIQQSLKERNTTPSSNTPLFPDELKPGESETRVGLVLRVAEGGGGMEAKVTYINYLSLPTSRGKVYATNTENIPTLPVILDTRFQNPYFNPQLFLLTALTERVLPVSCQPSDYQQFLEEFAQRVEQSSASNGLPKEQVDGGRRTSLPASLSASSMVAFFCHALGAAVPEHESAVLLTEGGRKDRYIVNYVQVDHPRKMCVLKGNIQSPATDDVNIQFFQEGNWVEFWQDSLIQLADDGSFQFSFPLDHSRTISLYHGYQTMRFYVEPGDTVQFSTNANAFYREMQILGNKQAENEFLLDFYHQMRGDTFFSSYDHELLEKDHVDFFHNKRTKEIQELTFLSQRASGLRPGFRAWMDRTLKLEHAVVQWRAARRFMVEKRVSLDTELLNFLQRKAALLYRLPRGKSFDFAVEEFLYFQYCLLQHAYDSPRFSAQDEMVLAQLLPSKEALVRHSVMQLFRKHIPRGELTGSGLWQLDQLMAIIRDSQLIQEVTAYAKGQQVLPPAIGIRTLQEGKQAPSWRFTDSEGTLVSLEDFVGKKLFLHIGWAENLGMALADVEFLQGGEETLPEIVHLLAASSKDEFERSIAGKEALFIFIPPKEMEALKENYRIDNRSNHYFLIGEDGQVLANHLDLGTARKLRGTWEKIATVPATTVWTPTQRLKFWQSLGISALLMLLISGVILWRRRMTAQREQRRRQLLEVELRGIRSQMNPHFLFNAMSSIQNLIRKQEQEKADLYLGQFAGLMRKTLRNTAEEYIPLSDEIETLEQYCSLESLRHPFQYQFQVDESIDAHNTYIPSMILQPIIENAIIHGLSPKTGTRVLQVQIGSGKEGLNCTVTDNGIGVLAAQEQAGRENHQSKGMKLIRQRLELMGLDGPAHLSMVDRSTLQPPAEGTLVSLTIPVEK